MLNVVCAALFDPEGKLLVKQRLPDDPLAGLWEFPGGKCEEDETPEIALARELAEELALYADPAAMVLLGVSQGLAGDRPLTLTLYHCPVWHGEPKPLSAAQLRWIEPALLHKLPMPEADIPLIPLLHLTR
jgi:8-oxo-dGTP diphosphatase